VATTSKTLNPYTAARQEWDERYGDLISRAKNWRLIAFLSMSTTLVCVTGMVTIGYRSHTVPYVVALDEVGRAVPVVPAKQVAVKDVRLQEATVARWITNLRTVVIDPVVQRKMVDEVYGLASASSAASQALTDWYQQNSPFARLQKETVDVSVESIVQQSSKSYEVVWSESTHDLFGQLQGTHRYRAIVTVNTQEVSDPEQALINPLGLYVTNFSWGEVVSPSSNSLAGQSSDGGQGK
jgi:type IV secretion system protein TrbF